MHLLDNAIFSQFIKASYTLQSYQFFIMSDFPFLSIGMQLWNIEVALFIIFPYF